MNTTRSLNMAFKICECLAALAGNMNASYFVGTEKFLELESAVYYWQSWLHPILFTYSSSSSLSHVWSHTPQLTADCWLLILFYVLCVESDCLIMSRHVIICMFNKVVDNSAASVYKEERAWGWWLGKTWDLWLSAVVCFICSAAVTWLVGLFICLFVCLFASSCLLACLLPSVVLFT